MNTVVFCVVQFPSFCTKALTSLAADPDTRESSSTYALHDTFTDERRALVGAHDRFVYFIHDATQLEYPLQDSYIETCFTPPNYACFIVGVNV